jgi:hypothetical protein
MVWLGNRRRIAVGSAKALLAFLAYVVFSLVVVLTGPCHDNLPKAILTMLILVFLVLIGSEVGNRASSSDWLNLQTTAFWVIVLAFLGFIVEMLIPAWFPVEAGYRSEGKFSGLFREPSHVAFSLFPCIAVLLVAEDKRTRQKGTLALVVLLVFSRSSTLIVLIAAWAIYRLIVHGRIRQTVLFCLGIASLVALGAMINVDRFILPTVQRVVGVAGSSETSNISSLVYLAGWQDAWFNLLRTHGTGLGLNMMGCGAIPDVPARGALALVGIEDANAADGSFLFAKIVSETGIAALAFYITVIWWWMKLEKKLKGLSIGPSRSANAAQAALIFCFVISSFVRSSGYFGGGAFLLWVVAACGASNLGKNPLIKPPVPTVLSSQDGGNCG